MSLFFGVWDYDFIYFIGGSNNLDYDFDKRYFSAEGRMSLSTDITGCVMIENSLSPQLAPRLIPSGCSSSCLRTVIYQKDDNFIGSSIIILESPLIIFFVAREIVNGYLQVSHVVPFQFFCTLHPDYGVECRCK